MTQTLAPSAKLAAAIAALTRTGGPAPFFRTMISLTVARRETRATPTLAVSDDWVLYWNPDWVAKTPLPTLVWGLYHECLHLRSQHAERAKALGIVPLEQPTPEQAQRWKRANYAQDASINEQLRAAHGKGLPADWIYPETLKQAPNLTWEQRFLLLEREAQQQQSDQGQQGQGDGAGHGHGQGGQGKDQSDDEGEGGVGAGSCGSCSAGGKPASSEGKGEGRSPIEISRAMRETARAIVEHVAKRAGNIPADLVTWAEEQLKPAKIDWRDQLSAAVRHAIHSRPGAVDYTFRRPSRRQAGLGYGVGAPVVPGLHQPVPRVAVIIDTSGSMSQSDLSSALAEVSGLLDALNCSVEFIVCDARVKAAKRITTIQDAAALMRGGGGTDLNPAFDLLEQSASHPELIVALTDGELYCEIPEPDYSARTLWVLIGARPGPAMPWGEHITIDDIAADAA